jgi:hypothetical protein
MKRLAAIAAPIVTMLLVVAGPEPIAATTVDPLVADVTKANDVVQLATLRHDRKTMDAMLAKDFVLVLTRGDIEDRAAWLDDVADTQTHVDVNQTSNLSIHSYNGDSALVIGILHLRYRRNDKLTDVRMRFIDVWVKQDGQWKWASSQVAHFPD